VSQILSVAFPVLSQVLDGLDEAVYVTDLDDCLQYVNHAFCLTFGYSSAQVIGRTSARLWRDRPFEDSAMEDGQQGAVLLARGGGEVAVSLRRLVLRDGRGQKVGVLRAVRDLRPIRQLEDELQRLRGLLNDERAAKQDLSVRDPATGLCNRREIQRILAEELENAVGERTPLSVMLLEVDYLAPIVERYGAARGDEILREIGKECERVFRVEDRVGRFDGERLLLVLPKTSALMALRPAERLREAIDRRRFSIAEVNPGMTAGMTISLGIAETPGDADVESSLVSAASFALCEAKGRGRNCSVRFSELGSCDRFDVAEADGP